MRRWSSSLHQTRKVLSCKNVVHFAALSKNVVTLSSSLTLLWKIPRPFGQYRQALACCKNLKKNVLIPHQLNRDAPVSNHLSPSLNRKWSWISLKKWSVKKQHQFTVKANNGWLEWLTGFALPLSFPTKDNRFPGAQDHWCPGISAGLSSPFLSSSEWNIRSQLNNSLLALICSCLTSSVRHGLKGKPTRDRPHRIRVELINFPSGSRLGNSEIRSAPKSVAGCLSFGPKPLW